MNCNDKLSKIKFRNKFNCPERINGTPEQLKEVGIEVLGKPSEDSYMWDYENTPIKMKTRIFSDVFVDWNDDHDCCDVFFPNGVIFGYVDDTDFRELTTEGN